MSVKLPFREKVGFGLGDTASNFVWAMMMGWLLLFYTDTFGISAAAAGTLFLFARAFDGVADFLMGAVADRTKTRWGKFRPYLLWMCVPMAITYVLTFTTPDLGVTGKIIYAWVTYNLMMLCYSAINIPYGVLSGVMTDDPLDRTSLNSYRMALAQVGGLTVNYFTLILVEKLGQGNKALGFQLTTMLFGVIMVALFLVSFAWTRERIQPPPQQKTSLLDDLKTLFGNWHWFVMFVTGVINLAFIIARVGTIAYYCKYFLGMDQPTPEKADFFMKTGTFMSCGLLFFVLGAVSTRFLVRAVGRKYGFMATMAATGIFTIPFYWLAPEHVALAYVLNALVSLASGMNGALYWAMIADTADFSEWKFKVRTTGICFSATACSQKIGMGFGGAIGGFALAYYGYQPDVVQTPQAIEGIKLLLSLIPGIPFILLAVFFSAYGLNESFCHKIREELANRRLDHAHGIVDKQLLQGIQEPL